VTLQKEGMMGWDARSGLSLADGKYICLIDGDDQMPSEDIARVYSKIKNSDLDLVQTYRVVRHDGVMRTIQSYFYNLIFKLMFPGSGVRDVNSKPKIFTKKVYDGMRLNSNDWFLDAEMIIHCARLKLKVAEIPTTFFKCKYRKSYVKFNAVFEFLLNLIMAKFSRRSQDA
jgi:glycosyltransferase involved in cell wall biosynthesis